MPCDINQHECAQFEIWDPASKLSNVNFCKIYGIRRCNILEVSQSREYPNYFEIRYQSNKRNFETQELK